MGIAGIVGGVASVAAAYKVFAPDAPMTNRRKALGTLNHAADELRYLRTDVTTLREILADSEIVPDSRFRLKTTAFLSEEDFRRYKRASESAFGRLGRLLKMVNKLDPLLPRLPEIRMNLAASRIDDIQGRLHRVIRDPEISVGAALSDLATAAEQVEELIDNLRTDLRGSFSNPTGHDFQREQAANDPGPGL